MELDIIVDEFVQFGGTILSEKVTQWTIQKDVFVDRNVSAPMALPKVIAQGKPRPYREDEDFDNNDPKVVDRKIMAHQTKWDFKMNLETLRNTYLSNVANMKVNPNETTFGRTVVNAYMEKYLAKIYDNTIYLGVYDEGGDDVVDIADGFGTIIANEITATNLVPIVTGSLSNTTAVSKVETFCQSLPLWMLEMGFDIYCSHATFAKYFQNYRAINGFGFKVGPSGKYELDGFNGTITKKGWMKNSGRLIAVPNIPLTSSEFPLHMATDGDRIGIYPTVNLDYVKNRMKMPIGFQIGDLDAIAVNDVA